MTEQTNNWLSDEELAWIEKRLGGVIDGVWPMRVQSILSLLAEVRHHRAEKAKQVGHMCGDERDMAKALEDARAFIFSNWPEDYSPAKRIVRQINVVLGNTDFDRICSSPRVELTEGEQKTVQRLRNPSWCYDNNDTQLCYVDGIIAKEAVAIIDRLTNPQPEKGAEA